MKKILSALAMVAMLSVSCTPETQPDENDGNNAGAQTPSLELKSSATLEFDAEGGSGVIEYELTNPVEGTDLTASADAADWISDLKVGASSTTFTVNEYTGTDAPRTTKVVVSYGGLSVEVAVTQHPASVEEEPVDAVSVVTNYIYGDYYGGSAAAGFNYWIILSDGDLMFDEEGYFYPEVGCCYYFLDLYSNEAKASNSVVLPKGTYTTADGSVDIESGYSMYYLSESEDVDIYKDFTSVSVSVTDNAIEVLATLEDGEVHKVVYKGTLELHYPMYDGSGDEPGDDDYDDDYDDEYEDEDDYTSNLTEDVKIKSTDCYFYVEDYGDYYEVGMTNWIISCYTESGDDFMFETLTVKNDINGDYVFYSDDATGESNYMLSYLDSYDGSYFFSDIVYLDDEYYYYDIEAPLLTGEMIIEYNESKDECVLLFDGYDNVGNHIEAELSGYCDIVEGSYIEYAKRNRMADVSKRANVVKQPKTKKLPIRK